ncbi:MAG: carbon starvation protein A, partial [Candidatus Firestonebacteria bacterium]
VALAFGTVYILSATKNWKYALITFLPSLFMFVTTITAGAMNIYVNYLPKKNYLNAGLSVIMIFLVLVVYFEAMRKIVSMRKEIF